MTEQFRIAIEGQDGIIRLSPPMGDNREQIYHPADLSRFAPDGNSVYGYEQDRPFDPFKIAGRESGKGGIVAFGSRIKKEDFLVLCSILGISKIEKQYAAYAQEAEAPPREGFIRQLRLVDRFGLRFHFRVLTDQEYKNFPEQQLTILEAMWLFVQEEIRPWTTPEGRQELKKKLGGSDWAWPTLSFGLMVENSQEYIYRIWSRVHYITK